MQTFQQELFHMGFVYRHHWLLPFYTTFNDSDPGRGSDGQCKVKPVGLILSHTFQLMRMRFDIMLMQFKVKILILTLIEIYWIKGNNCCFTDCIKTHKCWHAFKCLCTEFIQSCYDDRTLCFGVILCDLDLLWRSQRFEESKSFGPYVAKFTVDLYGIWFTFKFLDWCTSHSFYLGQSVF